MRRAPSLRFVAPIVIVALAVRSALAVQTWRDDQTLFQHVLHSDPDNVTANRTLGFLAARRGDADLAAAYYMTALRHRPDDAMTQLNLANLLLKSRRPAEATPLYERVAATKYRSAMLFNNWGIACIQLGETAAALKHFEQASQLFPASADAWANRGAAEARIGKTDLARDHFRRALQLDSAHRTAVNGMRRLTQPEDR